MFFLISDIQNVKNHVNNRVDSLNIVFGQDDYDRFNQTIENILGQKKYAEGEEIDPNHIAEIKNNINIAISNLSDHLSQNARSVNGVASLSNPVNYFATAVDALYITAMEKLGCPNMPIIHFDPNVKKTISEAAIKVHNSLVSYDVSRDNTFKQQRGKDANVVSRDFGLLIDGIKNGKKAESMGKMVAEYQALKARQNGHGAIWRFFHGKENDARNILLEKMSDKIKALLPDGMGNINLDEVNPSWVSRNIANARIRGEVELVGPKRLDAKGVEQAYGCAPADEEIVKILKEFSNLEQKEPMNKNANFLNDIIAKDDVKSEPIIEDDDVETFTLLGKD